MVRAGRGIVATDEIPIAADKRILRDILERPEDQVRVGLREDVA